jgi:hypothetical protein
MEGDRGACRYSNRENLGLGERGFLPTPFFLTTRADALQRGNGWLVRSVLEYQALRGAPSKV